MPEQVFQGEEVISILRGETPVIIGDIQNDLSLVRTVCPTLNFLRSGCPSVQIVCVLGADAKTDYISDRQNRLSKALTFLCCGTEVFTVSSQSSGKLVVFLVARLT